MERMDPRPSILKCLVGRHLFNLLMLTIRRYFLGPFFGASLMGLTSRKNIWFTSFIAPVSTNLSNSFVVHSTSSFSMILFTRLMLDKELVSWGASDTPCLIQVTTVSDA